MFNRLRKMVSANTFRELMSGQVSLTEEAVNTYLRKRPPPGVEYVQAVFLKEEIKFSLAGTFSGVNLRAEGSVVIKGISFSKEEQLIRLLPGDTFKVDTDNVSIGLSMKRGPGLTREIEVLTGLLPPELGQAIRVEQDAVVISLHKVDKWRHDLDRAMSDIPVLSDLGINLLDHFRVHAVSVDKGELQVDMKRV